MYVEASLKRVKEIITSSKYLTLSCDEVTTIDNQSWIFMHFNFMLFKIGVKYMYSFF